MLPLPFISSTRPLFHCCAASPIPLLLCPPLRRYIEVIDDRLTGEVLLDEALKMMKVSERMSVGTWIDLMSGE